MKGITKLTLLAASCSALASISGCTTTEFDAIVKEDGLNDKPSVFIEPHLNNCKVQPVCTRIGAEWHDAKPNDASFVVALNGIHTEITGASLNIDGETIALTELVGLDDTLYRQHNLWTMNWDSTHQTFLSSIDVVKKLANAELSSLTIETTNGTYTDTIYGGHGHRAESYDAMWRFLHEVDNFSPSVISDFE
ncbi:MAG: hypothetical protein CBC55_04445 [Gammaproteobacteria bacterium TMED95]|nr:MAG: hypothetical protein CBC55_04445 [Gammaproteobacteria bacterium TMED95]|tara:strand:+ start:5711 stop:6289 length:579 start_codon:yes stop_codon:yes gene_type:complete